MNKLSKITFIMKSGRIDATGDTYQLKHVLITNGFKWSKKDKVWTISAANKSNVHNAITELKAYKVDVTFKEIKKNPKVSMTEIKNWLIHNNKEINYDNVRIYFEKNTDTIPDKDNINYMVDILKSNPESKDPFGTKSRFLIGSRVSGQITPEGKIYFGKVIGYSRTSDDIYIKMGNKKIRLVGMSVVNTKNNPKESIHDEVVVEMRKMISDLYSQQIRPALEHALNATGLMEDIANSDVSDSTVNRFAHKYRYSSDIVFDLTDFYSHATMKYGIRGHFAKITAADSIYHALKDKKFRHKMKLALIEVVNAKNKNPKNVAYFQEMGFEMLADKGDDVSKVMDALMSEYGGELSDEEWEEVEADLQEYVDSLEEADIYETYGLQSEDGSTEDDEDELDSYGLVPEDNTNVLNNRRPEGHVSPIPWYAKKIQAFSRDDSRLPMMMRKVKNTEQDAKVHAKKFRKDGFQTYITRAYDIWYVYYWKPEWEATALASLKENSQIKQCGDMTCVVVRPTLSGAKTHNAKFDSEVKVSGDASGRLQKVCYPNYKYTKDEIVARVPKILAKDKEGCTVCKVQDTRSNVKSYLLGYEALKHIDSNYIVKVHDSVAQSGDASERCPIGQMGVRNKYTLNDIVASLRRLSLIKKYSFTKIAAEIGADIVQNQPFLDCNHRTSFAMINRILGFFNYEIFPFEDDFKKTLKTLGNMNMSKQEFETYLISKMTKIRNQNPAPNDSEPNASNIALPLVNRRSESILSKASNSSDVMKGNRLLSINTYPKRNVSMKRDRSIEASPYVGKSWGDLACDHLKAMKDDEEKAYISEYPNLIRALKHAGYDTRITSIKRILSQEKGHYAIIKKLYNRYCKNGYAKMNCKKNPYSFNRILGWIKLYSKYVAEQYFSGQRKEAKYWWNYSSILFETFTMNEQKMLYNKYPKMYDFVNTNIYARWDTKASKEILSRKVRYMADEQDFKIIYKTNKNPLRIEEWSKFHSDEYMQIFNIDKDEALTLGSILDAVKNKFSRDTTRRYAQYFYDDILEIVKDIKRGHTKEGILNAKFNIKSNPNFKCKKCGEITVSMYREGDKIYHYKCGGLVEEYFGEIRKQSKLF